MSQNTALNLILLAFALAFSGPVLADEAVQDDAAHITPTMVVEDVKQKKTLAGKAMAELESVIDKLCKPSPEDDQEKREEKKNREFKDGEGSFLQKFAQYKNEDSKIQRELSRYRIKFSSGDLLHVIDSKYFTAGIDYQYVVEPAFRNNEQLRKDIWIIPVGIRTGGKVNAGVTTTVRFTFSRFYGGKNAKWKAIKACPYFLTQTPQNTNEIKEKLQDGDGVRFEVIGTTGVGTEKISEKSADLRLNAGVKTEALFLMDLYKLNKQIVRTRILGIKNKGEVSVGFTVKTSNPLEFIKGKLGDALTLGLTGTLRKSVSLFSLAEDYPLDTMMVDFLYKFSTPEQIDLKSIKDRKDIAEAAMEELLTNIRHGGFTPLFFSKPGKDLKRDQELARRLLDQIKKTEGLAAEDLELYREGKIEAKDMRVRSFFKGRMQSNLGAGEGRLWFSQIFSKKGMIGNLDSFVTSYDENQHPHYYYLNNTFERAQTRKYFGREQHNYTHDFDILVNSDQQRTYGKVSDIVLRTEIQDTDLDKEDIQELKNSLARSLPPKFRNDPKFTTFFPTTDQTNAFISHRYVFGHEAFRAVGQYHPNNLGQMLYEFLDTHPEKKYMHLPTDISEVNVGGLGTYALEQAYNVNKIIMPEIQEYDIRKHPDIAARVSALEKHGYKVLGFQVVNDHGEEVEISEDDVRHHPELVTHKKVLESYGAEKSMEAFKIAKREPIFDKYIVGEFFASILPEEVSQQLFGLNLKITSRELGEPPARDIGNKRVSPVYEAVSFLKAVLSDPSFDMQLVGSSDHSGSGGTIEPSKGGSVTGLPARIKP